MLLHERCQYDNTIGVHPLTERVKQRIRKGPLAVRSNIRAAFRGKVRSRDVRGTASQFPVGSLVRVRSSGEIEKMLDARSRTRGLVFMPSQWNCCGHTYAVESHVRRVIDDDGILHPIARTVTLKGVHCGHGQTGCGKQCALYFRDEWLEAAPADETLTLHGVTELFVRVRSEGEIRRTLDLGGGKDGVKFMPEMYEHAGLVLGARRVDKIPEYGKVASVEKPLYILDGLRCKGAIVRGGCDRRCALLWHEQWLEFLR